MLLEKSVLTPKPSYREYSVEGRTNVLEETLKGVQETVNLLEIHLSSVLLDNGAVPEEPIDETPQMCATANRIDNCIRGAQIIGRRLQRLLDALDL